jgi:hypothetical protein
MTCVLIRQLEKPKTKLKTKRSIFGLLGRSHQQQQQQQLYDDGTNSIYPPPQKQSGQR